MLCMYRTVVGREAIKKGNRPFVAGLAFEDLSDNMRCPDSVFITSRTSVGLGYLRFRLFLVRRNAAYRTANRRTGGG